MLKGKASHPSQVKNSKKGRRSPTVGDNPREPNDPSLDLAIQDKNILITDEYNPENDSEYAVGPDEMCFYTFFFKGQGDPLDLMDIEDDQLIEIQNDLLQRLKAEMKTEKEQYLTNYTI